MHVQADTHTLKQTLKSSVYIFRVLRFMLQICIFQHGFECLDF